jgi:hypothetical protein
MEEGSLGEGEGERVAPGMERGATVVGYWPVVAKAEGWEGRSWVEVREHQQWVASSAVASFAVASSAVAS